MAKWTFKTRGDYRQFQRDLQWRFKEIATIMETATVEEIMAMLSDTVEKAVARTPVDEGSLRESGHAEIDGVPFVRGRPDGTVTRFDRVKPKLAAKKYTFEVGFWVPGGGTGREGEINTYAWVQHEHVEFFHPKGGEAKFLETAVIEERMKWRRRIIDAIREGISEVR